MSTAAPAPHAPAPSEPVRVIENIPGRLGAWPVNATVSRLGTPWKRRLSRAALLISQVRYQEQQISLLPDEKLIEKSMELRGKARGKWNLDKLLPEAFGLV